MQSLAQTAHQQLQSYHLKHIQEKPDLEHYLKDQSSQRKKIVDYIKNAKDDRESSKTMTAYEKAREELAGYKKNMLPLVDQNPIYQEKSGLREKGTCTWIFQDKEYTDWYSAPDSSLLWVSGSAGFGKSVLMSSVVERLKEVNQRKRCQVRFFLLQDRQ